MVPDEYERWLAATLIAQLITAPTVGGTAPPPDGR